MSAQIQDVDLSAVKSLQCLRKVKRQFLCSIVEDGWADREDSGVPPITEDKYVLWHLQFGHVSH